MSKLYTESIFMDSGAYGLYARNVNTGRMGAHGKQLEARRSLGTKGKDFSYYSLAAGSAFRKYCDSYAKFIKATQDQNVLVVNVDVLQNPELTWQVQQFFEKEHGVQPVPVVHAGEPLKYLEKYLEAGRYGLIGIGGLSAAISIAAYTAWADDVFTRICPKSNKYLPLVRTHGFAMTSWKLICRYPWWSVDSATWVKLSAYGWLYVPRWTKKDGWCFDKPPIQVNTSWRSPMQKKEDKHMDNVSDYVKNLIHGWLARCGVKEGSVDKAGKLVEWGVRSHFCARSRCNLYYFKDLEESRPPWPYPLNTEIIQSHAVEHRRGFGLS
jgi:hypothetical protein